MIGNKGGRAPCAVWLDLGRKGGHGGRSSWRLCLSVSQIGRKTKQNPILEVGGGGDDYRGHRKWTSPAGMGCAPTEMVEVSCLHFSFIYSSYRYLLSDCYVPLSV